METIHDPFVGSTPVEKNNGREILVNNSLRTETNQLKNV